MFIHFANEDIFCAQRQFYVYCCILVKWYTQHTHWHIPILIKKRVLTVLHIVFPFGHFNESTNQHWNRESSMKQTTFYLLMHLKWLKSVLSSSSSIDWINKTINFSKTKWIEKHSRRKRFCVQTKWKTTAFNNENKHKQCVFFNWNIEYK